MTPIVTKEKGGWEEQPPCHHCHFIQSSSTCKYGGINKKKRVKNKIKVEKKNWYEEGKKRVGQWEELWVPLTLPKPLKFT